MEKHSGASEQQKEDSSITRTRLTTRKRDYNYIKDHRVIVVLFPLATDSATKSVERCIWLFFFFELMMS